MLTQDSEWECGDNMMMSSVGREDIELTITCRNTQCQLTFTAYQQAINCQLMVIYTTGTNCYKQATVCETLQEESSFRWFYMQYYYFMY